MSIKLSEINDYPDHIREQIRAQIKGIETPDLGGEIAKAVRKNKYNVSAACDRTWNRRTYGSKAEMLYAQVLWFRREQGTVIEYIEQPRVWLGVPENVYVPDFFVVQEGGICWYVDVKGRETAKFKRDIKLWREYGRLPLHILRHRGGEFALDRIVESATEGTKP